LATFVLKVLNPKHVVFAGPVTSVFLPGDRTEFEILAHHAPVVSVLKTGDVIVDWKQRIPIQRGLVRFLNNECVILVEEADVRPGRPGGLAKPPPSVAPAAAGGGAPA
jgi:F-type H+-transporting ATPase subunit epsilon